MNLEKLIKAVKLCGSTPKVDQCKQCVYWDGGDMSKCIPRMTTDAETALSTSQIENQALRNAANGFKAENEKLRAELEQVKRERDAAVKTIFQWTGCPECKWWDSAGEWCEKHDREADGCGGCESPEWRGQKED